MAVEELEQAMKDYQKLLSDSVESGLDQAFAVFGVVDYFFQVGFYRAHNLRSYLSDSS